MSGKNYISFILLLVFSIQVVAPVNLFPAIFQDNEQKNFVIKPYCKKNSEQNKIPQKENFKNNPSQKCLCLYVQCQTVYYLNLKEKPTQSEFSEIGHNFHSLTPPVILQYYDLSDPPPKRFHKI